MPSSRSHSNDKDKRTDIGRRFEQQAALFFEQGGWEVLARNYRAGRKEIDLIVRKGDLIAFVEVKAARSQQFGHPAEKVDEKKQQHLIEAAQRFIDEHNIAGVDLRFDVVTFVKGKLEHYPGAFQAME